MVGGWEVGVRDRGAGQGWGRGGGVVGREPLWHGSPAVPPVLNLVLCPEPPCSLLQLFPSPMNLVSGHS